VPTGINFVLKGRSPLWTPRLSGAGAGKARRAREPWTWAGQAHLGPDVEGAEAIDYGFGASHVRRFYEAIRRYDPVLLEGALLPGYTGIRPRIAGPGEGAADFLIQGPETHGVPGLIHLFGIDSPGLTASLAIAERVAAADRPVTHGLNSPRFRPSRLRSRGAAQRGPQRRALARGPRPSCA
jgi:L-2-hydroxyglutarate oxidase LhgO